MTNNKPSLAEVADALRSEDHNDYRDGWFSIRVEENVLVVEFESSGQAPDTYTDPWPSFTLKLKLVEEEEGAE